MKKSFLFSALLAALLLTGCSESAETAMQPPQPSGGATAVRGETPVGFSAYQERNVTRGGLVGELDLTAIQKASDDGGGFGVFAYYTDLKKYDQTYVPNFMYNQKVEFNSSTNQWEYSPVLYWPNEYGSDAQSDDEDKVSFFAYAPYVAATSASAGSVAEADWGITGFSRNTTAGDPIVKYIASFDPSKSVDLCWGVRNQSSWAKIEGDGIQNFDKTGLPWLDIEHPKGIDQKLTFTFQHALAQLNVQIDADADVITHDESDASKIASGTKVYVRSISFTGIAMQGALNLNNSESKTATWLDYSGSTDLPYGQSVTVKDARRDGREGSSGAEANNELPNGLNSQIVQSTAWDDANATPGVTNELQNLFQPQTIIDGNSSQEQIAAALAEPVYVIPTGEAMTVTIVYDIETASENLTSYLSDGTTHGVSIENRITKTINFDTAGAGLTSGKRYTLLLHLGMNSVKFDAKVDGWKSGGTGDAYLPSITGEGIYNANNPLGIQNTAGNALEASGASATKKTITGLGDSNIITLQSADGEKFNTWTTSDQTVAAIAAGTPIVPAGTRGMRATTRDGEETAWTNRVANVAAIKIKPLRAGTATITAVDGEGNKSTCVITVIAPDINIVNPKMTLYKFDSDSPVGRLNAEIIQALNQDEDYVDDTWATPQAWEVTAAALADGTDKTDSPDDVLTISKYSENDTTFLITPVNPGTATVKLKTTAGAEKSFTVTIAKPSITLNYINVQLRGGSDPTKVVITATTVPKDLKVTFTNETTDNPVTYSFVALNDEKKATVTGSKTAEDDGTGTVTATVVGHTDMTATCAVSVACADPGLALYDAETGEAAAGLAVKRIICSDVAKSYATVREAETWGHTPIAMIAYVGGDNAADLYEYETGKTYKNLALALKDVSGTYKWSSLGDNWCDATAANRCLTESNEVIAGISDAQQSVYSGISNTMKLTKAGLTHDHPAAVAALDYKNTVDPGTTFAANSGWFLPSSGQWNLMVKTIMHGYTYEETPVSSVDDVTEYDTDLPAWSSNGSKLWHYGAVPFNKVIEPLGLTGVNASNYWSSTERNEARTWHVGFGHGGMHADHKVNAMYVRAVLAF